VGLTGSGLMQIGLGLDHGGSDPAGYVSAKNYRIDDITDELATAGSAAVASTSEINSATSATNAAGSEAVAVSAKDTAVSVSSQGVGVLNDQFMPAGWMDWVRGPSRLTNELYASGVTFDWDIGAVDAGAYIISSYAPWTGAEDASAFRVEI